MKAQGQVYRNLYDQGMGLSADTKIPVTVIQSAITDFAARNPDVLARNPTFVEDAMSHLGFKVQDGRLMWAGGPTQTTGPEGAQEPTGEVGVPDIMRAIRRLRSDIGLPQRSGSSMYSRSDMMADDLSEALGSAIKQYAPPEALAKFNAASEHWSKWAPIRNQAFSQFDPFVNQPIGLKPGMATIGDVAKTPLDVNSPNKVFISQLESYMGMKPGSLTGEARALLEEMNANEKSQLVHEVNSNQLLQDLKAGTARGISSVKAGTAADIGAVRSNQQQEARNLATSKQQALSDIDRNQQQAELALSRQHLGVTQSLDAQKANTFLQIVRRVGIFASMRIFYKMMRGGF